jgi:hypothetical protein
MFILLAGKVNFEHRINSYKLTYVDGEKTVCCALMLMALKFSGQSK